MRQGPAPRPDSDAELASREREALKPQLRAVIVCRGCGWLLTDRSAAIEVDGHHQHTRFNRAGFAYRIVCFRDASGCRGLGAQSRDFSWFAGHHWQIALCRGCDAHLGWFFGGRSSFVALIEDRIMECESSAS
ncbi:MAG: cereblon family protein [Myxococcales bacterium]|nr:cereblon family protein [Myxococcales bacterium]